MNIDCFGYEMQIKHGKKNQVCISTDYHTEVSQPAFPSVQIILNRFSGKQVLAAFSLTDGVIRMSVLHPLHCVSYRNKNIS